MVALAKGSRIVVITTGLLDGYPSFCSCTGRCMALREELALRAIELHAKHMEVGCSALNLRNSAHHLPEL